MAEKKTTEKTAPKEEEAPTRKICWLAYQKTEKGNTVPTIISSEFSEVKDAKAWYREMRSLGFLGPCKYQLIEFLTPVVEIT